MPGNVAPEYHKGGEMSMEKQERETIISWNDAENTVNVFTCHKRIMTKMAKLGAKVKRECKINGILRHIEYEVPRDRITIGLNPKRVASNRQIQALARARGTSIPDEDDESENTL